jgi:hypothetical protein
MYLNPTPGIEEIGAEERTNDRKQKWWICLFFAQRYEDTPKTGQEQAQQHNRTRNVIVEGQVGHKGACPFRPAMSGRSSGMKGTRERLTMKDFLELYFDSKECIIITENI